MANVRTYNYEMGFAVNGTPIPDPSEYSGADSALDASGERDATGYLHRDMVATKHPLKLKWSAMDWDMMCTILSMLTGPAFEFTYPDPSTGTSKTMTAYCGDREWNCELITNPSRQYVGTLNFSVIEY